MLFSFLNVDKKTDLRLRKRKASSLRITKRTQELLNLERAKRFQEAITVRDEVSGILHDCVDAVDKLDIKRIIRPVVEHKVVEEEKEPLSPNRDKHIWRTWLKRSYGIFMLLHPKIFNGNAADASETLGIARTTLLGWVSTNSKRNCVSKWYDIVKELT